MITVEDLKLRIRELFLNTHRDISVGYGFKQVGGEYTTEQCIVFGAVKKLPLSKIPENEVLPSSVEINGVVYNTDVIETGVIDYLACDNSITNPCFQYGYPPVAENTPNAQLQRPLLGGSFISSSKSGTLGFIAKHTATGKIVGVSNSHVLFDVPFNFRSVDFSTARQPTQDLSAGYTIYQPYPSKEPNDAIGKFLYIQPLKRLPFFNQADAAIMSLTATDPSGRPVLTTQSWKQVGLDIGTTPPPFATTAELDNLLNYPNLEVSSSGSRTGPKQGTCGLRISAIHVSTSFIDNVHYDDVISFTRINPDCNYPVESGDSGSAMFAKINGVWKIIGLVFAGSETEGVTCRIDYISQQLGIEAWDGTLASSSFVNPSSIQTVITAGTSSQDSLIINGKTYRQSKATISPATITTTTTLIPTTTTTTTILSTTTTTTTSALVFKPFTYAGGVTSRVEACSYTNYSTTWYFKGLGAYPTVGDTIYPVQGGSPYLLNGWLKISNGYAIYGNGSGYITQEFNCSILQTTTTTTTGIFPPVSTTTSTTTLAPLNFNLEVFCTSGGSSRFTMNNFTGGSNYYNITLGFYSTSEEAINGNYYSVIYTTGDLFGQQFSNRPAGTYWMAIRDALNPSNKVARPVIIPSATCPFPATTTTTTTINPNIQNTLYMGFPTPNTTWISFELLPL